MVLLLDEYLNSPPKPLGLDKDANQLEARNVGEVRRCDGKSGRVVWQMRELEPTPGALGIVSSKELPFTQTPPLAIDKSHHSSCTQLNLAVTHHNLPG